MLKKAGIFFPGYTNKAPLGICEEEEKRKEEAGGAVQAAQCYCGVFIVCFFWLYSDSRSLLSSLCYEGSIY